MISVLSTTNKYVLQPSLLEMHRQSLAWLSSIALWKRELSFFQKLLDEHGQHFTDVEDKKTIDHFQNLITYYKDEVTDTLRRKLRDHENHLAKVLHDHDEKDTRYFQVHDSIIEDMVSFDQQFRDLKNKFFAFIEKAF